uniref:Uncharacterized protein n=1 Tax=Brassica oleracea var. oleracea TaxID=109376 RepID=A0A0D3DMI6_BRAOL
MTMMAMGRDGAPTMTVRCPTGDNASGDHIVFNLQQRSFSSFSFHQKTTDAFTNLVTLGAKSKLMSLMVSVNNIDLESDEYVIETTTGASLHYQATTGASLLHQATTGASLHYQATTGASLLHQASTGASLMQRIQVQNLLKQKLTERKFVERLVPSSSAFSLLNMAEKVPSFKIGGTLWFTDLTTADTTYILPLLTAITFIIMVEEGMEGNPVAGTMKKFSRIIAFLSLPILMGIEKEEVDSVISDIPRDGPRRPTKNAVWDWAAYRPAVSRPKTNPQRSGTGRENPIDISIHNAFADQPAGHRITNGHMAHERFKT